MAILLLPHVKCLLDFLDCLAVSPNLGQRTSNTRLPLEDIRLVSGSTWDTKGIQDAPNRTALARDGRQGKLGGKIELRLGRNPRRD